MVKKTPKSNQDIAKKKALEAMLEETKTTLEDKVAALRTIQAVDAQKISAALSSMLKKS
jgi:hypothetical protein